MYVKIKGVNRWVRKYIIKECQRNFYIQSLVHMNHEATFVYSTIRYFSSLPLSLTTQKGQHTFNEELFNILFSSPWTMCVLVLYPRAALMTGLLSSSQDFLWHSSPQHLSASQTPINSHLQHLCELRGYCPALESQNCLGWKECLKII